MEKTKPKFNPEGFFGFIFRLADIARLTHLSVISDPAHRALHTFYDRMTELADEIVENWQGYNEKIAKITIEQSESVDDIIPILKQSSDYFQKVKPEFQGDIQGLLDEASGLCNKTIYKLRFLK